MSLPDLAFACNHTGGFSVWTSGSEPAITFTGQALPDHDTANPYRRNALGFSIKRDLFLTLQTAGVRAYVIEQSSDWGHPDAVAGSNYMLATKVFDTSGYQSCGAISPDGTIFGAYSTDGPSTTNSVLVSPSGAVSTPPVQCQEIIAAGFTADSSRLITSVYRWSGFSPTTEVTIYSVADWSIDATLNLSGMLGIPGPPLTPRYWVSRILPSPDGALVAFTLNNDRTAEQYIVILRSSDWSIAQVITDAGYADFTAAWGWGQGGQFLVTTEDDDDTAHLNEAIRVWSRSGDTLTQVGRLEAYSDAGACVSLTGDQIVFRKRLPSSEALTRATLSTGAALQTITFGGSSAAVWGIPYSPQWPVPAAAPFWKNLSRCVEYP